MTEKDLFIYQVLFKNAFLTKKGNDFQLFFSTIMNHAYPSVFIPTCTWGRLGDKKCDGYILDKKTIFQVYAPREIEKEKTIAKIYEDFGGALEKWGTQIKEWVFVDNAYDGVPVFIVETLNDLKKQYPDIEFRHMGFFELKKLLFEMSDSIIEQILGPIPKDGETVGKPRIITSEYWEVLRDLCNLMLLDRYDWWNDHAMRGLLYNDLVENKLVLIDLKMCFVWPGLDNELERIVKDLIDRFDIYIDIFMEHSFLREDSFWGEYKFYKEVFPNPNYHDDLDIYKKWEVKWFKALNNYVVVLNSFIQYINTNYTVDIIALKRKKAMIDSMGIYCGVPLTEQHLYPNTVFDIE